MLGPAIVRELCLEGLDLSTPDEPAVGEDALPAQVQVLADEVGDAPDVEERDR